MIEDLNSEDDQQELLILLLALAQRYEELMIKGTEPFLLDGLLKIRRRVERMRFDGMSRQVEYSALKEGIVQDLLPYSDSLQTIVPGQLQQLLNSSNKELAKIFEVDIPPLKPLTYLLGTLVIGSRSLRDTLGTQSQLGRQVVQVMRDLEAKVMKGILTDKSTEDIARDIVNTRKGKPAVKGGSVASTAVNRLKNTIKAIAWQTVRQSNSDTVASKVPNGVPWVWNAILDSKTCPICQPLHKMERPNKDSFPFPYKPSEIVHPRCRCLILPKIRLK